MIKQPKQGEKQMAFITLYTLVISFTFACAWLSNERYSEV